MFTIYGTKSTTKSSKAIEKNKSNPTITNYLNYNSKRKKHLDHLTQNNALEHSQRLETMHRYNFKTILDITNTDTAHAKSYQHRNIKRTQNHIKKSKHHSDTIITSNDHANITDCTSDATTYLSTILKQNITSANSITDNNFKTKYGNINKSDDVFGKEMSHNSENRIEQSVFSVSITTRAGMKSNETGKSLLEIARRLSRPYPDVNDPAFQNLLDEYRSQVHRFSNANKHPQEYNQGTIIKKMQQYQNIARLNAPKKPGQYDQGHNYPQNYLQRNPQDVPKSFPHTYPAYKYPGHNNPVTGPWRTSKKYPGQMAWQLGAGYTNVHEPLTGQQQQFGRGSNSWSGRQGPTIPDGVPVGLDDLQTPIDGISDMPDLFNYTGEIAITIPETIATRFTTILTTTTKRLRTTPGRPNFEEDCDYTAYYCLKAYDTGKICGRTLFNNYVTFKNYCMMDFVNCMERYEMWVIIHMGECFEIKLVSEYVHYPYMDDYFLDQYYINENM